MNRVEELYTNLTSLVESNEAFYYVDYVLNSCIYRVFTYRLASYTDFLLPDALECRGHMFRLNLAGELEDIASWSLEKFFNLHEVSPDTNTLCEALIATGRLSRVVYERAKEKVNIEFINSMKLEFDNLVETHGLDALLDCFPHLKVSTELDSIKFIHDKRDGSVINTYVHEGKICTKSKTALTSDQALDANRELYANSPLLSVVSDLVHANNTVTFEYTSPTNRIVLPYQRPELKILAVRDNSTGEYMDYGYLYDLYESFMVKDYTNRFNLTDPDKVIESMYGLSGIEGFVIGLSSGQRFKVKTTEYFTLHRAKDSIQTDKNLFTVVLNDLSDDLRAMFHDDQYTLDRISAMEQVVIPQYNHLVSVVEGYHRDNKHLSQKDYAVKAQSDLNRLQFHLSMQLFNGKLPNYKEMMIKYHEDYL